MFVMWNKVIFKKKLIFFNFYRYRKEIEGENIDDVLFNWMCFFFWSIIFII